MKVKIEIDQGLPEEEVIIRCSSLNEAVINLQNFITDQNSNSETNAMSLSKRCLTLSDGETDYFIPVEEIFFFETEGRELMAHTKDKMLTCDYKLYELEEMLPISFMRISKSTIANLEHIYSITRNLTASSVVEFKGGKKRAMVSRSYYKMLVERLKTRKIEKR